MPALESDLRRQLENVIIQARDVAEVAARSALQKRAVDAAEPFPHFGPRERELRIRLRARGRQAGDVRNEDKTQSINQLTQELAYEYWHRMLFARFLAENHLLMHPDGVAVSLEECDELANDLDPPAPNGFVLAARYASTMLPEIFRTDDVLLEIDFAPEQRLALEKLLGNIPLQTFFADDSLGWAYQFWQSEENKKVNKRVKSGEKVNGCNLPAVTQFFTEHYMVQFLLHNTIGAWWCARHNIKGTAGSAGVTGGKSPVEMEYLRWRDDGTPAAGTFDGWPKTLADFTMMDPCCGSGHFLVAAFNLLVPLRMHDEKLTAEEACEAVLRDNLFGLELDPRCTQIAAFALALSAWKYRGEDGEPLGYRQLPQLHIACPGQGVTGKREEWTALAAGNSRLTDGMEQLYDLFLQAPELGSLIDPRSEAGDLFVAGFNDLRPLLEQALSKEANRKDADSAAMGVVAQGIAKASDLLSRRYVLVATNVPYLKRGSQTEILQQHCDDSYSDAKSNIATAFMARWNKDSQTIAVVVPQNWLYQPTYVDLRNRLLSQMTWCGLGRLGPGAFETISGEVVNVCLLIAQVETPDKHHQIALIDATKLGTPTEKAIALLKDTLILLSQAEQLKKPGHIVSSISASQHTLEEYASSYQGMKTGDDEKLRRCFWEVECGGTTWTYYQSTVENVCLFGGLEHVVYTEDGGRSIARYQGLSAWGKTGVAVSQMSKLPCAVYIGNPFDSNMSAIIPKKADFLLPILAYCSSSEYQESVRAIDDSIKPTNSTLLKVPFDLTLWESIASEKYPTGLPKPHSDDPTQWVFDGKIASSTTPLQVAIARMLGYRWPEQSAESDSIETFADSDGIACLPGVRGEAAASERLMEVLRTAYGTNWSDTVLHKMLTDAGCKVGATLDDWLRNLFFEQHCRLFHNRPFIWHIWDGRKDGFSALVNYHKLDHKVLENLTYAYLGDWITAQSKSNKAGADLRVGASQELQAKLKLILAGEPPYDIFVRWKPLHAQAIGWHPDLNDGIRMNIRPFMEADLLRKKPNIKWGKDRGTEPERSKDDYPWFWSGKDFVGERLNDVHLTNAEKQAARSRKKGAK